jgi:hypothetical protein
MCLVAREGTPIVTSAQLQALLCTDEISLWPELPKGKTEKIDKIALRKRLLGDLSSTWL